VWPELAEACWQEEREPPADTCDFRPSALPPDIAQHFTFRDGKAVMQDCYAIAHGKEFYVEGLHLSPYEPGSQFNHDPKRRRKLLLHKSETIPDRANQPNRHWDNATSAKSIFPCRADRTKNNFETASLLQVIAKREQIDDSKDFSYHFDKKPLTLKEQQEYIVSSLPGIGPTLAKPLLKKFGSVRGIVNAEKEDLEKVDKLGPKKAENIKEVMDSKYG